MNTLTTLNQSLAVATGPGWVEWLLVAGFIVICVVMMLVILIQKPKGGGLSGAFGGGAGGGSDRSFVGARAGDVLTWVTVACFLAFLLLAMGLTWQIGPDRAASDDENVANITTDGTGTTGTNPEDNK